VIYADQGITKAALAAYYRAVADRMLPHIRRRPLSLVRCPGGSGRACFFQRHAGSGTPEEIERFDIPAAEGTEGDASYLVIDDLAGLVAAVQIGVLELHPWGSTVDRPERPDRLVFDLDPAAGLPWARVVEAAVAMRESLEALGFQSFVKTTGGKGLHLVVPLDAQHGWDEAHAFARAVAEAMVAESPHLYTANMRKEARRDRIFIDYLRNTLGASAVAPYSPRARSGAPVATPVTWAELGRGLNPKDFTVDTVPQRVARTSNDPWADLPEIQQKITPAAKRALGL
jgi:bifunctional non-homologous end joining protein LigD